jgi:methylmalonyl-CoA mutase cobalamin-binding subunit
VKFSKFQKRVQKILAADLPSGESVRQQGRSLANEIRIGRTAFMDKMGVDSELEYKRQCVRDSRIMFHAHIGMSSWPATTQALTLIYRAAEDCGVRIDRAGICLDRRMGLPKANRDKIPAETGPMLETAQEWMQIGRVVPIQPHMGDFMIGFPAAVENTLHALSVGVTTIGNLSQFFAHEVPMWQDTAATTVETVKAIAIMGALRDKGTLVHSYLEDGYGALFCDCTTVCGWAYLEKYIVEDLLGAKLAHCIGGLTTDPVKRTGWIFALNEIHENQCTGSMIYGDTLSFSPDFAVNRGLVAEYLMWDIMAQLKCPTGHAVLPLPVTEALRVPSAEEIAEAQIFGRRIEQSARRLFPYMDFSAADAFSKTVLSAGKSVFESSLAGLKEAGVDIRDPIQLLYVLKKLGPAVFEEMFGAGKCNHAVVRGREPVIASDVFELSNRYVDKYREIFTNPKSQGMLKGRRILIASTDVHEHAIMIIHQLLAEAGADMINLGAEVNPDKIVSEARAKNVEAILISTHNGMALDYAKRLKEELDKHSVRIPVVLGGVLNQKVEDQPMPIDVSADLKKLDFYPCPRLEGRFRKLLESGVISKDFNK